MLYVQIKKTLFLIKEQIKKDSQLIFTDKRKKSKSLKKTEKNRRTAMEIKAFNKRSCFVLTHIRKITSLCTVFLALLLFHKNKYAYKLKKHYENIVHIKKVETFLVFTI